MRFIGLAFSGTLWKKYDVVQKAENRDIIIALSSKRTKAQINIFKWILDMWFFGICERKKDGGDWKRKYGKRKYRRMEYASTEYVSTNMQGWKTQVRKTQVRKCNGGKRKYSNLTSILKSLRFSSLAFSVDPLSVGLVQFTCTVPDRCYTQEIGLKMDSCAEGHGFKNRRRDAVE